MPRFTPRQLDAFVAVVELRSFAAAAQHLSLTPSAVCQLVNELENELENAVDFKLFDRSTRRVEIFSARREF